MKYFSCLTLLLLASLVHARIVLERAHVDISVAYDGELHLEIEHEDEFATYEPDEAILLLGVPARTTRPPGAEWDFIGAAPGQRIWVSPQVQDPNVLYLGLSAEEVETGVFDGPIRVELVSVVGPGHFSVWRNGPSGNPLVRMATFDGIDGSDFLEVQPGSHTHQNWCLTRAGRYLVTLRAVGFIGGDRMESEPATFYFAADRPLDIAMLTP